MRLISLFLCFLIAVASVSADTISDSDASSCHHITCQDFPTQYNNTCINQIPAAAFSSISSTCIESLIPTEIAEIIGPQFAMLNPNSTEHLTAQQFAVMNASCSGITPAQAARFATAAGNNVACTGLTQDCVARFTTQAFDALRGTCLDDLMSTAVIDCARISGTQIATLTEGTACGAISDECFAEVSPTALEKIGDTCLANLPVTDFQVMTGDQLAKIPASAMSVVAKDQVGSLPSQVCASFTVDQVGQLASGPNTDACDGISTACGAALQPGAISAMNSNCIRSVTSAASVDCALLSSSQFQLLNKTSDCSTFNDACFAEVNPLALTELSSECLTNLPLTNLQILTGPQLSKIPAHAFTVFTKEKLAVLSSETCSYLDEFQAQRLATIHADACTGINITCGAAISAAAVSGISRNCLSTVTQSGVVDCTGITASQIGSLDRATDCTNFLPGCLAEIQSNSLSELSTNCAKNLPNSAMELLDSDQIAEIPSNATGTFNAGQLGSLVASACQGFSEEQAESFGSSCSGFSANCIGQFQDNSVGGFMQDCLENLHGSIAGFSAGQLTYISPIHFALFGNDFHYINADNVAVLSTEQLQAIAPLLTNTDSVTCAQVEHFSSPQLSTFAPLWPTQTLTAVQDACQSCRLFFTSQSCQASDPAANKTTHTCGWCLPEDGSETTQSCLRKDTCASGGGNNNNDNDTGGPPTVGIVFGVLGGLVVLGGGFWFWKRRQSRRKYGQYPNGLLDGQHGINEDSDTYYQTDDTW